METINGREIGPLSSRLETKYRDIADGNYLKQTPVECTCGLETKYRDIADGNKGLRADHYTMGGWKPSTAI